MAALPLSANTAKPPAAAAPTATPAPAVVYDSVAVGQYAPAFSLPNQEGQAMGPKEFAGKWLVLYFYPKDFTGGCTLEAHNFQRDQAAYAKSDAVIVGVSMDTPGSHKDFCAKEGLDFRLLADTAGAVSERYGSVMNIGGKRLSARHTFLIDPKGKVAHIFYSVEPAKHSEEVLAALGELRKK